MSLISHHQHNKILIIEDDPIIALELSLAVEEMGCYVVGIVKNYSDALHVMTHTPANILLCDITLQSKESGIDIVKRIYLKFTPSVIYLSASVDMQTIKLAIDTNPCGYLVKPYRYAELFALISLALRQSKISHDGQTPQILDLGGGYRFMVESKILTNNGFALHITAKERALLSCLASQPYKVVCFKELEYHIWPNSSMSDSSRRTLIYRLQTKLNYQIITVLQGNGCCLSAFVPQQLS